MSLGLDLSPDDPAPQRAWPAQRDPARYGPLSVVETLVEREGQETEDATFSLRRYWRLAVKYRWLLACALALGLAAGVAATLLTTPIYRASATVQIDEEPAKVVAIESERPTQAANAEKFYQTQYELLKSRALAERVVRNEGLANDTRFLNQWGKAAKFSADRAGPRSTALDAARTAYAVELLADQLRIEPVRLSRIVRVSYESPDPATAMRIANAVAANYISWNLERRYEASAAARKFLEERLDQTRQALEEAQERGNAYAQKNQLITVDSGEDSVDGRVATGESLVASNLASASGQLASATAARIQAEQRWRQSLATPDLALPEILANPTIQALRAARAAAWADYQQNLKTYKPDWPAMVEARGKIDTMDQQVADQIAAVRSAIRTELEVASKNEAQFQAEVERRKRELLDAQDKRVKQSFINTDISTSKSLYDGMLASYKQIGVAGGIGDNNISIVDRAERPHEAVKPRARDNLIQFGLVGLLLGAGIAFLRDRFDLSLKSPAAVESELRTPVLGAIPLSAKDLAPERALEDPRSPLSEAYCSVRAALQFSTENGAPPSLLVTSSRPSEGKTTTALAVAAGFARLGLRVLLVDGDMRDPSLHKILGRDNGVGLSNLLASGPEMNPALQPTNYDNLSFLACGPLPPNPAELLGGGKTRAFMAAARAHFDLIVIDGPPVMGFADAPLLANATAGVVFVVAAGETNRDVAKVAIRRLRTGAAHLLGVVVTKLDLRDNGAARDDGYGYSYNYGGDPAPARRGLGLLPASGWFAARRRRA